MWKYRVLSIVLVVPALAVWTIAMTERTEQDWTTMVASVIVFAVATVVVGAAADRFDRSARQGRDVDQ